MEFPGSTRSFSIICYHGATLNCIIWPTRIVRRQMKITQKFVNSLSASDVGETYWDPDLKGFGLRVNRNLTMSYIVHFRVEGKQRKKERKEINVMT